MHLNVEAGLEGTLPGGWVGCPSVPPAPGAGYLLSPAHTSSIEHICLVWVKRPFSQGCRCASTAASPVSVPAIAPCRAVRVVCVVLPACPGTWAGGTGLF